jgi:hypothetical protein
MHPKYINALAKYIPSYGTTHCARANQPAAAQRCSWLLHCVHPSPMLFPMPHEDAPHLAATSCAPSCAHVTTLYGPQCLGVSGSDVVSRCSNHVFQAAAAAGCSHNDMHVPRVPPLHHHIRPTNAATGQQMPIKCPLNPHLMCSPAAAALMTALKQWLLTP